MGICRSNRGLTEAVSIFLRSKTVNSSQIHESNELACEQPAYEHI